MSRRGTQTGSARRQLTAALLRAWRTSVPSEEWRGFEHIVAARKRGKGGILITAHLGNWELGGILLALAVGCAALPEEICSRTPSSTSMN